MTAKSNTQLLKEELSQRKTGNVTQTVNELSVKFDRNKRHLTEAFKLLGSVGIITVDTMGRWVYNDENK